MIRESVLGYAADFVAVALTVAIISTYQLHLRTLSRRDAAAVLSTLAKRARAAWVAAIMTRPDTEILAVQTLRNSTMAATFFASTSVLLMIGVPTLSAQGAGLQTTWHAINLTGSRSPEVWSAKLLCILLVLFFAFFCFTNSVRLFNVVGYTINVRGSEDALSEAIDRTSSELNRAGGYFSNGMRAYYYVIPPVCWLFGPTYMVGSAILLTTTLLPMIDRVGRRSLPRPD